MIRIQDPRKVYGENIENKRRVYEYRRELGEYVYEYYSELDFLNPDLLEFILEREPEFVIIIQEWLNQKYNMSREIEQYINLKLQQSYLSRITNPLPDNPFENHSIKIFKARIDTILEIIHMLYQFYVEKYNVDFERERYLKQQQKQKDKERKYFIEAMKRLNQF